MPMPPTPCPLATDPYAQHSPPHPPIPVPLIFMHILRIGFIRCVIFIATSITSITQFVTVTEEEAAHARPRLEPLGGDQRRRRVRLPPPPRHTGLLPCVHTPRPHAPPRPPRPASPTTAGCRPRERRRVHLVALDHERVLRMPRRDSRTRRRDPLPTTTYASQKQSKSETADKRGWVWRPLYSAEYTP
jgi:hypothetical protein